MSKGLQRPYPRGVAAVFVFSLAISSCGGTADKHAASTALQPPPLDDSVPVLVKENYLGQFNIIRYQGKYYALAQDEGPFAIEKIQKGHYRRAYTGSSMEDVGRQVTEALAGPGVNDTSPVLVQEGYKKDFNIIRYRGNFYALAQDEGVFDFQKVQRKEYKRLFNGSSVDELKRRIP